jgi:formylglycine-generating enzyme required for sulfatase activity
MPAILLGLTLVVGLIAAVWIGMRMRRGGNPPVDPKPENLSRNDPSKPDPVKPTGKSAAIDNKFGMRLVYIEPGTFDMGSPSTELKRESDEVQHRVRLTKGFYMGATLVTQQQWKDVMSDDKPGAFDANDLPVDSVSWEDCRDFCRKLSAKDGRKYRLPYEAEWEYACRAGTRTPFWCGATLTTSQANYSGDFPYRDSDGPGQTRGQTTKVREFTANPWGLHDMHGNLWQWCEDLFGDYPTREITDPIGATSGDGRILRGGSWGSTGRNCRAAYRLRNTPQYRAVTVGFRVVLTSD